MTFRPISNKYAAANCAAIMWVVAFQSVSLAGPLPFNDGRYTSAPDLCSMTDIEIYNEYGDGISKVLRTIDGESLQDLYEGGCNVTAASQNGARVSFTAACSVEGEDFQRNDEYEFVSADEFRHDDRNFKRCLVDTANATPVREAPSPIAYPLTILCTTSNAPDIVVTLSDHREFDRDMNCVAGEFVVDMSGCAPDGGYSLASPTGAPVVIEIVDRWQDYRDHVGGVTRNAVDSNSIYFAGGFIGPISGYSEKWALSISRLTGEGKLLHAGVASPYQCEKRVPLF